MTAEIGPPQHAVQLQRMLEAHQGVFITSPEYSASVTPLVKNTIDWLSRSRGRGGGMRSLMALRQILELGCGALVIPEQIAVGNAAEAFDEMDNLKDQSAGAALKAMARRLVELARAAA